MFTHIQAFHAPKLVLLCFVSKQQNNFDIILQGGTNRVCVDLSMYKHFPKFVFVFFYIFLSYAGVFVNYYCKFIVFYNPS